LSLRGTGHRVKDAPRRTDRAVRAADEGVNYMKVILTAEVKGKGHEGDIVEVARGYAVNFLLPRKMAIAATSGNIKQLDARMSNIRKRNAARMTDAEGVAAALDGKTVRIEAKAGVDGKLFGSVTALMIEEAVAAQLGADVDHKRMNMSRPIKTVGDHVVVVGVFGDVKASLNVKVVGEGAPVEAEPVVADAIAAADAAEAAGAAEVADDEPLEAADAIDTAEDADDLSMVNEEDGGS
jgi:large subunit ribosomal protein L9